MRARTCDSGMPSSGLRYINGHLFLVSLNHHHRYNSLPIHITAYLSTSLLFFVPSGHKLPIYKDALQQYGLSISQRVAPIPIQLPQTSQRVSRGVAHHDLDLPRGRREGGAVRLPHLREIQIHRLAGYL